MTAKELFLEAMRRTDAGDIDGFVALQAPDCVWRTPDGEVHGHEELRAWLGTWVAGFPDERRHALERVEQHGSTVIAEGVFHGVNAGARRLRGRCRRPGARSPCRSRSLSTSTSRAGTPPACTSITTGSGSSSSSACSRRPR